MGDYFDGRHDKYIKPDPSKSVYTQVLVVGWIDADGYMIRMYSSA